MDKEDIDRHKASAGEIIEINRIPSSPRILVEIILYSSPRILIEIIIIKIFWNPLAFFIIKPPIFNLISL